MTKKFNINNCVVQFVVKNVKKYSGPKSGCRVGVSPASGTIGAFANSSNGTDDTNPALYALISNHVAKSEPRHDITVNFIDNQTDVIQTRLGKVEISNGLLDIAAVKVDIGIKSRCDTRLRTLAGKPTMGKTFNFMSGNQRHVRGLMGRQVYIHGAVTSGRRGKITHPAYTVPYMPSTFVIVEDDAGHGHFAEPGDSGALVCAEMTDSPFVEVISTIQGEIITSHSPTKSGENKSNVTAVPTGDEKSGRLKETATASESGHISILNRLKTGIGKTVKDDSDSKAETTSTPRRYLTIPLQAGLEQIRNERKLKNLKLCNEVTEDTHH